MLLPLSRCEFLDGHQAESRVQLRRHQHTPARAATSEQLSLFIVDEAAARKILALSGAFDSHQPLGATSSNTTNKALIVCAASLWPQQDLADGHRPP